MKTITQYRPMIFSCLTVLAEQRFRQRRQFRTDLLLAGGYISLGFWLGVDTGFVVWDWQFWLMFLPLFVAGELAALAWRAK